LNAGTRQPWRTGWPAARSRCSPPAMPRR